jgi:hypothetical protein
MADIKHTGACDRNNKFGRYASFNTTDDSLSTGDRILITETLGRAASHLKVEVATGIGFTFKLNTRQSIYPPLTISTDPAFRGKKDLSGESVITVPQDTIQVSSTTFTMDDMSIDSITLVNLGGFVQITVW